MSYYLFLDDIRDPSWVHWCALPALPDTQWAVVRNLEELKAVVQARGVPTFVALDYDLDAEGMLEEEPNGLACAQWLWAHCQGNGVPFPSYAVHSFNRNGRQELLDWLADQGAPAPWANQAGSTGPAPTSPGTFGS